MSAGNLTSVARIKQWLGGTLGSQADDLLGQLARNASAFILNYCNRSFAKTLYTEIYDGYGQRFMVLRQPSVIEVQALGIGGQTIPKATGDGLTSPFGSGWVWDGRKLTLNGYSFPTGRAGVYVRYTAGFTVDDEAHAIPASPYQIVTDRFWIGDEGVTLTNGTPLTKVAANPTTGQYAVSDVGVYTFAAADTGTGVLISYSYCPDDVVAAATEICGERYKFRDRIGVSSKALGGQETVSFTSNQVPQHVKELLNSYLRVTPI